METKFSPIKGILVHRLPEKYQREALNCFSGLSVRDHNQDALGLKIFFEHYDCARKTILWGKIMVREEYYDIYPLVTNLTVRHIRCHTGKYETEKFVQSYGPVYSLYSVNIFEENDKRHKTVSLSDDYRVVLNIPEIQANYRLEPIVLPKVKREFPVLFFCRLCRRDGHKQYQCPDKVEMSSGVSRPEPGPGRDLTKYRRRSELIRRCESFEEYPIKSGGSTKGDFLPGQCSPGITSEGSNRATYCRSPDYGNSVRDSRPSKFKKIDFRDPSDHREKSSTASSSGPPVTYHYSERYKSPSSGGQRQNHQPPNRHFDNHSFPKSISQSVSSTVCSPDSHRDAQKDIRLSRKLKYKKEKSLQSNRLPKHDGVEKRKEHETEYLQRDRTRCEPNGVTSVSLDRQAKNSVKDSIDVKAEHLRCLYGTADESSTSPGDAPSSSKSDRLCNTTISMNVRSKHLVNFEASTAKGSSREGLASDNAVSCSTLRKRKEREGIRMSLLTPPSTDPVRVLQLIRHAYNTGENPQIVEQELENLLSWIQAPDRPKLSGKEAAAVQHLRHNLDEIHSSRIEKEAEEPVADLLPKQEVNLKREGAVLPSKPPKKVRCRRTSVCQGVVDIIKGIDGELSPIMLENFLMQVRGRRKKVDMARIFTLNIPGLIYQLKQVERAYYISGRRGGEEDIDIRFIKDLYQRLERDISEESQPLVKTEFGATVHVKTEPA